MSTARLFIVFSDDNYEGNESVANNSVTSPINFEVNLCDYKSLLQDEDECDLSLPDSESEKTDDEVDCKKYFAAR